MFNVGDRVKDRHNEAEWTGHICMVYESIEYWSSFSQPFQKIKEEWGDGPVCIIKLDKPDRCCTEEEYIGYFGSNKGYEDLPLLEKIACPEKWLSYE
jgi:hypothetical protein